MRGGTANCTVIISDEHIPSPFSSEPDTAVIMNLPSLNKFIKQVKSGGQALINSSLIDEDIERDDIDLIKVSAGKIASKLGNDRIANMVMLGAYLKKNKLLTPEDIEKSLKEILPERRHNLLAVNKKALSEGLKIAK
ncbi:MAG: 2-oxoacid:acceptor oxidoreductase family protein [Halanaerobiales bacterium]